VTQAIVWPLAGLTQLTSLSLGVNRITTPLGAFAALTNLQSLNLSNMPVPKTF